MSALLKAIFQPKDGTRQRIREEVVSSQLRLERAANRFETTIKDMLDRNDRLTGRATGHQNHEEDDLR